MVHSIVWFMSIVCTLFKANQTLIIYIYHCRYNSTSNLNSKNGHLYFTSSVEFDRGGHPPSPEPPGKMLPLTTGRLTLLLTKYV